MGHFIRAVCCVGACAAMHACGSGDGNGGSPPECDEASNPGECFMDCTGTAVCSERTIVCPEDLDCRIHCEGLDACDTSTVQCPPTGTCAISCEGVDACGDMDLECGSGDCSMACGTDPLSCEGATIHCGSGHCSATCEGSEPPTLLGCDAAASCTEC